MTKQMRDFAIHYAATRNATESCRLAGYSEKYALSKSHLLLKNDEVKELITNLTDKYYKSEFQKLALDAISTLKEVMQNELSPSTQLAAVKYVLSEAGVTDVDDSKAGTIQIKVTLPKELE